MRGGRLLELLCCVTKSQVVWLACLDNCDRSLRTSFVGFPPLSEARGIRWLDPASVGGWIPAALIGCVPLACWQNVDCTEKTSCSACPVLYRRAEVASTPTLFEEKE